MKKVAFCTLGCKVNQYETNSMMQMFIKEGYEVVDFKEFADVYVINTCTVTSMSDRKSRQMIRRVKNINPKSIVCAVGCYAQVSKDELLNINDLDIIAGTNDKKDILKYVNKYIGKQEKIAVINDIKNLKKYDDWGEVAYSSKTRAELKIQDGCDRYCTYCIIPYARGEIRSRDISNILEEANKIVETGIKEIIITGIHISSYGRDINNKVTLVDVLEKLNEIDNLKRIRISSLDPTIITEEFVNKIKKIDKLCNHFHLSLQSGCDETLKRMNRKYTTEEFRNIVRLLRENIPEVALTTDIIVGFPGETEEEFNNTYEFLKEINFSKMHIFKYSPRKGTPAEKFKDKVDDKVKEERSKKLISLSEENEKKFAEEYIGKEIEVLFENDIEGHTTNYITVLMNKR